MNPTIESSAIAAAPLSNVVRGGHSASGGGGGSSSTSVSSSQENIVQVSPQYFKLKIRPSKDTAMVMYNVGKSVIERAYL